MTDIAISDITNSTKNDVGTGSFDVLMESVGRQIESQFNEQRITGSDYATVYLGGLQAVLQQAMEFALKEEQAGLEADKVTAEIDTVLGTTAKLYAEISLLDQKSQTELAQTTDPTGGLLLSEQTKVLADINLIDQKTITETAATVDPTGGILLSTQAKIDQEELLLTQKTVTELAQTTDPTGGLTFAQKNLYEAQIKGFAGKHENELLKIYLDTWAVIYSINDGDLAGTDFGIPDFVLDSSHSIETPPIIDAQAITSAAVYD